MKFAIVAKVRKRGAIGIFYEQSFLVEANNTDVAKDQWFNEYSIEWQLDHFISIKEPAKEGLYVMKNTQ